VCRISGGVPSAPGRRRRAWACRSALCASVLFGAIGDAGAQVAAPPTAATWGASVTNLLRVETWRFFEPPPSGGDPDYTFLGDRLRLEVHGRWPRAEVTVAAQYVGLAGLPETAQGPGPFGTGALYFNQGGRRTNPQQLYLKYANVTLRGALPGVDLQFGRMAYTSGAEARSGSPKIETLRRQRLDARLVGEFEWSQYQRSYDGIRFDLARSDWKATAIAFMPSQGGFARVAGPTITDVIVAGGTVSSRSTAPAPRRTEWQAYGLYYSDDRPVTERPDNTGQTAARADIGITTFGGVALGAYAAGRGEIDVFAWAAAQSGNWYGQDHTAFAVAAEAGYQWSATPWRPWIRGGLFHASGDEDPADDQHGTFFPLLPTVRRFSQTTVYGTMNLHDVFVQVQARPRPPLGLRFDVHRVNLDSAADLWYAGSGATLGEGSVFGYSGRRSNGSDRLGTSLEGSVDYTVQPGWTVHAFLAHIDGGPVVTGTFSGSSLWYAYAELAVTLSSR
jgi:hypothetical protein